MIGTIVVGTDGSQTARRAVAVAAGLARRLGATLHVVHGYHAPGPDAAGTSVWRQVSEAVVDEAVDDPAVAGVTVVRHSVANAAARAIVEVAAEVGADLIVVGNRGLRTARAPGESIPDAVVHQAPCHVLVAKTT